ncbi:AcrR family transcriptional regulator [Catenuloplanes nepalensis]|uniref:AcrR family transcriptional regulator n=1 Tax=Catenuloplanes nepalensis TaxID=587533 RepID=A0ABT9MVQ5_9ACTN|nr:TetR/AcrR family transcriptional regulator [Catenuloplanes nepalensis]MDP9795515.1 AcrR family transcriptional regulator [Catenuloplanes nepalensis]
MARPANRSSYHHGDLRAALIDIAVELIAERGVDGFSLAEASRRLGVAVSAPYRHFTDRDDLVAAAALRGCAILIDTLAAETASATTAEDRLAAAARAYVRFAAEHRALFEAVFAGPAHGFRDPRLEEAAAPVKRTFQDAALTVTGGDAVAAEVLGLSVVTVAHGHAGMLRLGAFGPDAIDTAVDRAGRAALAVIAGRDQLKA